MVPIVLEPARVAQRLQHIRVAGGPVLGHGPARELVVLRVVLVLLGPVDEMHDVEAAARDSRTSEQLLRVRIRAQLGWQLCDKSASGFRNAAPGDLEVGVAARAARIANVLLALVDVKKRGRKVAARWEKIDLEHDAMAAPRLLEHVIERSV